ncbi:hypothetical protein AAFF_G00379270 [Aldrovandia affinis]|uniref:MACPF domain-containing protein n=1 Tax=Aldrovandia affinis TaxID=143900 RepID=A0AAD7WM01_9TELE|nr:hypothetical protein AAFF_G00379270 [Aldrovandia affinis]
MDSGNLSVIFAPNLLHSSEGTEKMSSSTERRLKQQAAVRLEAEVGNDINNLLSAERTKGFVGCTKSVVKSNGRSTRRSKTKPFSFQEMYAMVTMSSERYRGLFMLTLPILVHVNRYMACRTGSLSECEKASFIPGYNLAGEGFDVVTMHRKGAYVINVKSYLVRNETCTLCENRFQEGQSQKLPASVLDWRPFSRCKKQLTSTLHHSVDSLIRSSTSLINNDWGVGLNLDTLGTAILGGSRSEIAQFARSQFSVDKATFATHEISCTHYSYRLADHPTLSTEFSTHLQRLPKKYNHSSRYLYRRMIDTYGTHYIRQVQLGGRVRRVTAFRTCLATLQGFSETEIKKCLDIDLKMALGFLPVNASLTHKCSSILKDNVTMGFYQGFMTHNIEVLGGEKYFGDVLFHQDSSYAYTSWMSSLHDNPDVVSYSLFPLHHLVSDLEVSTNLRRAVLEYIEENKLEMDRGRAKTCSPAPNLDHNCCPLRAGLGHLSIVVEKATGLKADVFSEADGFVKVWYNERKQDTEKRRLRFLFVRYMLPYKLIYFNMRGRAELSRYILAYAEIPFMDQRVEWKNWPSLKASFPLEQLPVLEVEGGLLNQSLAIARFLAKETGLAGNGRFEEAQADTLVDSLNDFTLLIPWREEDQGLKKQKIDKLFDCQAPKLLGFLEKHLGDRDWLVGNAVTWADLYWHVCFTTFNVLRPGFAEPHPGLCALIHRVGCIPQLAQWIQNRPNSEF